MYLLILMASKFAKSIDNGISIFTYTFTYTSTSIFYSFFYFQFYFQ